MQTFPERIGHIGVGLSKQDVARVYFSTGSDGRVTSMRGLVLKNHLTNVACLAERWDFQRAFEDEKLYASPDRQAWLIRAAERHDLGKPGRFRIVERVNDKGKGQGFTYSFSGHRFDMEDPHPYVQQLIRLHHSFSVDDVLKAQATLMHGSWPELSEADQRKVIEAAPCFPLDLYALEMCDQIEAEAATYVFGEHDERHRVFMEFEVYPDPPDGSRVPGAPVRLRLFPYPFKPDEVRFTFESFVVCVPPDLPRNGVSLKQLLLAESPQVEWQEPREVVLCRQE